MTGPCLLDKDPGPCEAAIRRYFFNRRTGQCEQFIYGGCLGNANNFKSELSCRKTCRSESNITDCMAVYHILLQIWSASFLQRQVLVELASYHISSTAHHKNVKGSSMVVVKETLIVIAPLMNVPLVVAHIREWSTLTVCAACKHAVSLM